MNEPARPRSGSATMIEPGELHGYFIVREIATGRDVWILGGDIRYEVTGNGFRDYRASAAGEYFLAECANRSLPFGRPMRLEEVEPLPKNRGLWHPDAWEHISRCPKCLTRSAAGIRFRADYPRAHAERLTILTQDARFGDTPVTPPPGVTSGQCPSRQQPAEIL
jgi:hypothetical protein